MVGEMESVSMYACIGGMGGVVLDNAVCVSEIVGDDVCVGGAVQGIGSMMEKGSDSFDAFMRLR